MKRKAAGIDMGNGDSGVTLDFSNPHSASGDFIRLARKGKLNALPSLVKEYRKRRAELLAVDLELGKCNDPAWLLQFYVLTRRKNRDFEETLRQRVDQLERRKATLSKQLAKIEQNIRKLVPSESADLMTVQCSAGDKSPVLERRISNRPWNPAATVRD